MVSIIPIPQQVYAESITYDEMEKNKQEEKILSSLSNDLDYSNKTANIIRNSDIKFGTIKDEDNNDSLIEEIDESEERINKIVEQIKLRIEYINQLKQNNVDC